jgi:flagellar hook-length control protein FliK
MNVSSLISPTPAHSDLRPIERRSRDSDEPDFGAIYGSERHRHSNSDRPRGTESKDAASDEVPRASGAADETRPSSSDDPEVGEEGQASKPEEAPDNASDVFGTDERGPEGKDGVEAGAAYADEMGDLAAVPGSARETADSRKASSASTAQARPGTPSQPVVAEATERAADGAMLKEAEAATKKTTSPNPAIATSAAPADQRARAGTSKQSEEEVVVRRVRDMEASKAETQPKVGTRQRAEETIARTSAVANSPELAVKSSADIAQPDLFDSRIADLGPVEARSTADHVARAEAAVRHDAPRPVMQQVAEAARALREGTVELTLKPEELGTVKMTLASGADGTMSMSLQAERPETLDLLRRHIDELARELREMGFENLSFSFAQDGSAEQPRRELQDADETADRPLAAIPLANVGFAAQPAAKPPSGGLDLRI